jgi:F0F1-type ATP synthase assembly protein I
MRPFKNRARTSPIAVSDAEAGVTEKEPNKVTGWRQIGVLSAIPFILALAPIVGYFLGAYLDKKFRTAPWLSYVLLGLGFVAGVRETINLVKLAQRED